MLSWFLLIIICTKNEIFWFFALYYTEHYIIVTYMYTPSFLFIISNRLTRDFFYYSCPSRYSSSNSSSSGNFVDDTFDFAAGSLQLEIRDTSCTRITCTTRRIGSPDGRVWRPGQSETRNALGEYTVIGELCACQWWHACDKCLAYDVTDPRVDVQIQSLNGPCSDSDECFNHDLCFYIKLIMRYREFSCLIFCLYQTLWYGGGGESCWEGDMRSSVQLIRLLYYIEYSKRYMQP